MTDKEERQLVCLCRAQIKVREARKILERGDDELKAAMIIDTLDLVCEWIGRLTDELGEHEPEGR